jgi:predicted ATP-dependent serine protease
MEYRCPVCGALYYQRKGFCQHCRPLSVLMTKEEMAHSAYLLRHWWARDGKTGDCPQAVTRERIVREWEVQRASY